LARQARDSGVIVERGTGVRAGAFGAAAVGLILGVSGCGANHQSTLRPASKAARDISALWWVMLVGSAVIVGVVVMLLVAAFLRRRGSDDPPGRPRRDRGPRLLVAVAGLAIPIVVLVALFVLTVRTLSTTSSAAGARQSTVTIEVTGRQWFWDVVYPGEGVRTANELHIPTGETVTVVALTGDVIHSIWVPELNRKIDAIPGRRNVIRLQAERSGTYRGQCAEFCGLQHAHMAFEVIAEPRADFDAWLAGQQRCPRARRPSGGSSCSSARRASTATPSPARTPPAASAPT
jgi:cytochrome c oxidase subunit 2